MRNATAIPTKLSPGHFATTIGVECCWLKLTLMIEALDNGYDAVLFVDADAYIQPQAPRANQCLFARQILLS